MNTVRPPSPALTFPRTSAQAGNALFLILIAVALFAALSYAVTTSGRGGGTVDKEKSSLWAGQITQYGAYLQSVATRMVLTGTDPTNMDTVVSTADPICVLGGSYECLFDDGGAQETSLPANAFQGTPSFATTLVDTADTGLLPDEWKVTDIGTTDPDIILMIPAVNGNWTLTLAVCEGINKGLGLSPTPATNSTAVHFATDDHILDAQPGEFAACIENGAGSEEYFYYHTLVER